MKRYLLALLIATPQALIAAPEDFYSIQSQQEALSADIQGYSCPDSTAQLIADTQALLA